MALMVVKQNPKIYPGRFAELVWPDAPGWTKNINVGHGSTRGAGMPQAGGHWLGKLRIAGLVHRDYSSVHQSLYTITQAGLDYLEAHRVQPEWGEERPLAIVSGEVPEDQL